MAVCLGLYVCLPLSQGNYLKWPDNCLSWRTHCCLRTRWVLSIMDRVKNSLMVLDLSSSQVGVSSCFSLPSAWVSGRSGQPFFDDGWICLCSLQVLRWLWSESTASPGLSFHHSSPALTRALLEPQQETVWPFAIGSNSTCWLARLWIKVRVFLDEISAYACLPTCVDGLSRADCFLWCGWVSLWPLSARVDNRKKKEELALYFLLGCFSWAISHHCQPPGLWFTTLVSLVLRLRLNYIVSFPEPPACR